MSSRLALALLLACASASSAWACRIPDSAVSTDAQNVERADAIFIGHITRLDEVPGNGGTPMSASATYRLVEAVKGDVAGVGTIAMSYSNCHVTLLPGGDYIVFADRDRNGRLTAMPGHAGTRSYLSRLDTSTDYLKLLKHLASHKTPKRP